MKSFIKIVFLSVLIAILFSACLDKKEPSKSNFKRVINNYYKKNDKDCPSIGFRGSIYYNSAYSNKFPVKLYQDDPYRNFFNHLVDIGLLVKNGTKVYQSKYSDALVDGYEYNLTAIGTKAFKNGHFCAGKYKVTKILQFTNSARFSEVRFIKVATDVPKWAFQLLKQESYSKLFSEDEFQEKVKLFVGNGINDKITLILSNNGWISEQQYNQNIKK